VTRKCLSSHLRLYGGFRSLSDAFLLFSYGFGQHADYVFGWEGDSLQRAMNECTSQDGIPWNCPALTVQDTDAMNNCRQAAKVPEVVEDQCQGELHCI